MSTDDILLLLSLGVIAVPIAVLVHFVGLVIWLLRKQRTKDGKASSRRAPE